MPRCVQVPDVGVSLQRSHVEVAVKDVDQSGELSDHRVSLSHAHLRHRHQHLKLHLLAAAGLCRHVGQHIYVGTSPRNTKRDERRASSLTWSHLHSGRGGAGAALRVGHLQLEQVGAFDQVGEVERGLSIRAVQYVLEPAKVKGHSSHTQCEVDQPSLI